METFQQGNIITLLHYDNITLLQVIKTLKWFHYAISYVVDVSYNFPERRK